MSVTKTFNFRCILALTIQYDRIRVEDKELSYYLELPGGKTGPGFEELRMAIAQEVQEEICNVDDYFITCKNVTEGAHKEVLKSDIVLRRALRHLLEDEVLEVTLIKRRAKPMHDFFGKHEKQEVPKTIYSVSVSSNRPFHNVQQTSTTISDEGDARIPWTPVTNGLLRVNDVESLGFTQMPKQLLNAQTQTTSPQVTKKCSQFLATENEKGESSRPVLAATSWRLSQTVSRWLQNYEGSTMPQGTTGNVDEEPKHNTVISSRRFVGSEGGKLVRAHTLEPPHSNSHSPLHRSTRLSTQKPNDIDHRDLKRQRRQLSNSIPATVVHPRPKDPFLTQLPISFAPGEHYFVYKWAQVWESLGGSGTGTRWNGTRSSRAPSRYRTESTLNGQRKSTSTAGQSRLHPSLRSSMPERCGCTLELGCLLCQQATTNTLTPR
ncbi:hypothetical protein BC938DRAFT_471243 [Jimgerdemannia flammicorona]|uniref:Uncharacterized protein n=1 Tax=Jimgerdemannia flammicorona TaxID=994334 RepID=A0A433Q8J1_9FUNG|nr:hypothetical protein BC938DRAFT_471243 [Jimgerdemannia flammicorona]